MPFNSVKEARDKIPALSSLSDKQVKQFNKVFNSLLSQGMKEGEAIPIAISEAKKIEKDENVRAGTFTLVSKAKASDVERDEAGNIIYQGKKFAGFNKPRASDRDGKDGMVVAKKGDEIKLVHFGDSEMRHNYSVEANDRYYARHGEESDTFSARYWSHRWLWPKGSLKGKGGKPWVALKKSEDMKVDKNITSLAHFLQGMLAMLPNSSKEEDEMEEYIEDAYREDDTWHEEDLMYMQESPSVMNVVKQFDEEEMVAIEPLYINVGEADAHGDGISDEELDKLIDNFNKNISNIQGNIHHSYMTDGFKPIKAYRMPMTVYVGNPDNPHEMVMIPEGQPVVKVKFTDNEIGKKLWEKRKSGVLRGVSIGAKGKRVKNPDYEGNM